LEFSASVGFIQRRYTECRACYTVSYKCGHYDSVLYWWLW